VKKASKERAIYIVFKGVSEPGKYVLVLCFFIVDFRRCNYVQSIQYNKKKEAGYKKIHEVLGFCC
jgi:hypothetical protein